MPKEDMISNMAGSCLMGRARLLTRVLTGIYDDELRPFGLKATQLNLLVVVAQLGPVRRIEIGRMIHLDPSTLTRNLQVMLNNGWIEEVADDEDGRGLPLQATRPGMTLLEKVSPAWECAQGKAGRLLGADGAALLRKLSSGLFGTAPGRV
ncbi:MAG: MarR family transcriptional [Beijerinckiaceae bacterium]|nr:MAG: MarR family transcriptional [Beijerinckiaceae bacterium]